MTAFSKSFILITDFSAVSTAGQGGINMGFINAFVSYLLLLLIFVAVGGAAVFLGITMRRNANAKADQTEHAESAEQA